MNPSNEEEVIESSFNFYHIPHFSQFSIFLSSPFLPLILLHYCIYFSPYWAGNETNPCKSFSILHPTLGIPALHWCSAIWNMWCSHLRSQSYFFCFAYMNIWWWMAGICVGSFYGCVVLELSLWYLCWACTLPNDIVVVWWLGCN